MISKQNKNLNRKKRHVRLRHDLSGTTSRPRLCVYRSLTNIYAQIIDDTKGVTLVSCNTTQKEIKEKVKDMTNKEQAKFVGEQIAKLAKKKKITEVVFDRGGYLYTGRVKELADGARAGGLKF
ncbi:MAG: 50S ribosomal protein L18 [Clostridiales bacterium]|nr:50S ribosomal protein L18 [Clostridiales bacterium]